MTTPPEDWYPEAVAEQAIETAQCQCHYVNIGVGYQKAAEDPLCPRCTTAGLAMRVTTALYEADMLKAPGPIPGTDPTDDFFKEDEPLDKVLTEWDANKHNVHLTQAPREET